jgi:hypothetical protein
VIVLGLNLGLINSISVSVTRGLTDLYVGLFVRLYLDLCGILTEPPQKMRGLSPKIISGDSRQSDNTQTHYIKAYHTIY